MKLEHMRRKKLEMGMAVVGFLVMLGCLSPIRAQYGVPIHTSVTDDGATIENVSDHPVAAIEGTFTYRSSEGKLVTSAWRQFFRVAFLKDGDTFEPGQRLSFPKESRLPDGSREDLNYVDVTVTGIVFADGSTWGTADALRSRITERAAALRLQLRDALLLLERMSPEEIESLLHKPGLLIQGRVESGFAKVVLRKRLLDEDGRLVPDPIDRVKQLIADVESPFSN